MWLSSNLFLSFTLNNYFFMDDILIFLHWIINFLFQKAIDTYSLHANVWMEDIHIIWMAHEAPLGSQTCPCVMLLEALFRSLPHGATDDGGWLVVCRRWSSLFPFIFYLLSQKIHVSPPFLYFNFNSYSFDLLFFLLIF